MAQIILTLEQATLLLSSASPIQLCDPHGNVLTSVSPLPEAEFIKLAKERSQSAGPWFKTAEVLEHFDKLQQAWDREGGFDRQRMHDLLNELQKNRGG